MHKSGGRNIVKDIKMHYVFLDDIRQREYNMFWVIGELKSLYIRQN